MVRSAQPKPLEVATLRCLSSRGCSLVSSGVVGSSACHRVPVLGAVKPWSFGLRSAAGLTAPARRQIWQRWRNRRMRGRAVARGLYWLFAVEGVVRRRVGGGVGVEVSRGWKFSHRPSGRPRRCLTLPSACPDLTTFCRLDELGLGCRAAARARSGGAGVPGRRAATQLVPPVRLRRDVSRDTVMRRLAHEPLGWRPTTLLVTVRRYRCTGCGHVWRQDTSQGGRAAGEAVAARAAVGAGGHRGPAPDRRPGRRGARGRRGTPPTTRSWPRARRVLIEDPRPVRRRDRDRCRRARVAAHPPRRQVRHRDHRPHPDPRRHRPGPAAGHGRGPLETGVQDSGSPNARRPGATASRSSRWTGSPGSRPPPPRSCPTRSR